MSFFTTIKSYLCVLFDEKYTSHVFSSIFYIVIGEDHLYFSVYNGGLEHVTKEQHATCQLILCGSCRDVVLIIECCLPKCWTIYFIFLLLYL